MTLDMKMELVSMAKKLSSEQTGELIQFMAKMNDVEEKGNNDGTVKLHYKNLDVTAFIAIIDHINALLSGESLKRQKLAEPEPV